MKQLSPEESNNLYEALPEKLQSALMSPNYSGFIELSAQRNHLDQERTQKLILLVGHVLLGFLHPEDLSKEIAEELKVDKRIADELTKEIKLKILRPLTNELIKTHGYHMEEFGSPQSQTQTPSPPLEETPLQKSSQPTPEQVKEAAPPPTPQPTPEPTQPQQAAPTILHEYKGESNQSKKSGYPGGLVRPSFYEPPGNISDSSNTDNPQARLEIGSQTPVIQPTTRVGKEDAHIVHYSAPEAPSNPFGKQKESPETPSQQKKDVPKGNVINLKDLPK